jgi:hypothetical protein
MPFITGCRSNCTQAIGSIGPQSLVPSPENHAWRRRCLRIRGRGRCMDAGQVRRRSSPTSSDQLTVGTGLQHARGPTIATQPLLLLLLLRPQPPRPLTNCYLIKSHAQNSPSEWSPRVHRRKPKKRQPDSRRGRVVTDVTRHDLLGIAVGVAPGINNSRRTSVGHYIARNTKLTGTRRDCRTGQ